MKYTKKCTRDIGRFGGSGGLSAADFRTAYGLAATGAAPAVHAASHITGTDKLPLSGTDKLLGRLSAGAGTVEEITCTAAGRAILDDADNTAQRSTLGLGDSATKNVGTAAGTVAAGNAAPNAHKASHSVGGTDIIQVSATDKLLGRSSAGAGDMQEITCTAAARTILDDTSVAAIATTLGLGTASNVVHAAFTPTGQVSGTLFNKQATYQMLGLLLNACADCRLLLGFNEAVVDNGTTLDYSTYLQTTTYVDAGNWADSQRLKKGWVWSLNPTATDDYLVVTDAASLSMISGGADIAFTVFVWAEITAGTDVQVLIAKSSDYASRTNSEWSLYISELEVVYFVLSDPSASARIGRTSNTIAAGWHCFCITYSGSGTSAGINIYVDGAVNNSGTYDAGAYVAMEDTAQTVGILAENDNGKRWLGDIGSGVCIDVAEWAAAKVKAMYTMTRGFYNL